MLRLRPRLKLWLMLLLTLLLPLLHQQLGCDLHVAAGRGPPYWVWSLLLHQWLLQLSCNSNVGCTDTATVAMVTVAQLSWQLI